MPKKQKYGNRFENVNHNLDGLFLTSDVDALAAIKTGLKRIRYDVPLPGTSREYKKMRESGVGGPLRREAVRLRLSERQNNKCAYCHCEMRVRIRGEEQKQDATFEHIIPARYGGPFHHFNLVMACRECNTFHGRNSTVSKLQNEVLPLFDHLDWDDGVIPTREPALIPLNFNGVSALLPEEFRRTATLEEVHAATERLFEELARAEMGPAIQRMIRGERLAIDDPRYLRLQRTTSSKKYRSGMLRRLSEAQNHRCVNCHKIMLFNTSGYVRRAASLICIIPREYGGPTHEINYAVACQWCNQFRAKQRVKEMVDYFKSLDTEQSTYISPVTTNSSNLVGVKWPDRLGCKRS